MMKARVAHYQPGPRLGNTFLEDEALQRYLRVFLGRVGASQEQQRRVEADLTKFGDKCAGEYMVQADNAERFKPQHEQFNQWGQRVDRVLTSEGWKFFKRESAIEGLIALPYENGSSAVNRMHQVVKLMMFSPSSGMFSCPLAMTDGAALELKGILEKKKLPEKTLTELDESYKRLTSRDPAKFWTSGQWFTEKMGGSDLTRAVQTVAVPRNHDAGDHALSGYKWFTSAIDSDMTLTFGQIVDNVSEELNTERKPLSLFYLRTRKDPALVDEDEIAENTELPLNNIHVVRLKDKMATRQLPTAELVLEDSSAFLISEEGSGVREVQPMLLLTRLHNAISSVAYMVRVRSLAVDFACQRKAFSAHIVDKPLHVQSLAEFDLDTRGNILFLFEFARLVGTCTDEREGSPHEQSLLRALGSLLKAFTALECVRLMREGVELFGAVGVMENHISTLFRDSQVMPIWEGTTNTLSLDLLRVAAREPEAVTALYNALIDMKPKKNKGDADLYESEVNQMFGYIKANINHLDKFEWNARRLTMNISRLFICGLAARTVEETGLEEDALLFSHWLQRSVTEKEKLTDPSLFESYRKMLPKKANGMRRDERGHIRSLI